MDLQGYQWISMESGGNIFTTTMEVVVEKKAAHIAIQLDPDPDRGLRFRQPKVRSSIRVGIMFSVIQQTQPMNLR